MIRGHGMQEMPDEYEPESLDVSIFWSDNAQEWIRTVGTWISNMGPIVTGTAIWALASKFERGVLERLENDKTATDRYKHLRYQWLPVQRMQDLGGGLVAITAPGGGGTLGTVVNALGDAYGIVTLTNAFVGRYSSHAWTFWWHWWFQRPQYTFDDAYADPSYAQMKAYFGADPGPYSLIQPPTGINVIPGTIWWAIDQVL